jgi:polyhydroxyalkanoate synthesis regulator phasin
MAKTRAQKIRAVNQDELRVLMAEKNTVKQIIDNIEKIEELNPEENTNFVKELNKYKTANEQRIRLLNKYLPDLREDITDETDLPPIIIKLADGTNAPSI